MCVCVCVCVCVFTYQPLWQGRRPSRNLFKKKKRTSGKKNALQEKKTSTSLIGSMLFKKFFSGKKNVLQEKKDALQEKKRSTSLIGSMPFKKSHGKASACLLAGPQLYTCAQEQIFYRVKNNLQGQIIHKYRYLRISFRTGVIWDKVKNKIVILFFLLFTYKEHI